MSKCQPGKSRRRKSHWLDEARLRAWKMPQTPDQECGEEPMPTEPFQTSIITISFFYISPCLYIRAPAARYSRSISMPPSSPVLLLSNTHLPSESRA